MGSRLRVLGSTWLRKFTYALGQVGLRLSTSAGVFVQDSCSSRFVPSHKCRILRVLVATYRRLQSWSRRR